MRPTQTLEALKVLCIPNWVVSRLSSGDSIWERPQSVPPLQVPAQLPMLSEHTSSPSPLTQLCLSMGHCKPPETASTSVHFRAEHPSEVNIDPLQISTQALSMPMALLLTSVTSCLPVVSSGMR